VPRVPSYSDAKRQSVVIAAVPGGIARQPIASHASEDGRYYNEVFNSEVEINVWRRVSDALSEAPPSFLCASETRLHT
jgi:hypothetical protein